MNLAAPAEQESPGPDVAAAPSPRIGTWVWSPWYARIWWLCIVVYWSGRALAMYCKELDRFYMSTLAAYLNLVFMPMTPFLLLGIGFAWAWMDHHGLEFGAPDSDHMRPTRSVGGWLDPMSDPLDPRSPLYQRRFDEM